MSIMALFTQNLYLNKRETKAVYLL